MSSLGLEEWGISFWVVSCNHLLAVLFCLDVGQILYYEADLLLLQKYWRQWQDNSWGLGSLMMLQLKHFIQRSFSRLSCVADSCHNPG
jgi:hypothetical protein